MVALLVMPAVLTRGLGIVGAVERFLDTVPVGVRRTEDVLLERLGEAALAVGPTLLQADGPDDLRDLADDVVLTPEFVEPRQIMLELASAVSFDRLQRLSADFELGPELTKVLGKGPATKLASEAARIMPAAVSLYCELAQKFGQEVLQTTPSADQLFEFITNERVPVVVRKLILHALRGDAALVAIIAAADRQQILEPWLALALAELVILGERSRLRFATAIPGLHVPEHIVPLNDRFDPHALDADVLATEEQIARWADEAARSGQRVYFPLADLADEEG